MKTPIVLFIVFAITACSNQSSESTHEFIGTKSDRIAQITRLLARHAALPSSVSNAYCVEDQHGDNVLGPADFYLFCALSVAPADIPAWRSALLPLEQHGNMTSYAAPKKAAYWWLPSSDFNTLEFYSPETLTGRRLGWVGIQPLTGKIYVYAFTM